MDRALVDPNIALRITMAPIDMRDVGMHGRGMALVYITISFSILALFLVSMRLVTRLSAKCTLGMDDYAIALSMVCISRCWRPCVLRSRDRKRRTAILTILTR